MDSEDQRVQERAQRVMVTVPPWERTNNLFECAILVSRDHIRDEDARDKERHAKGAKAVDEAWEGNR